MNIQSSHIVCLIMVILGHTGYAQTFFSKELKGKVSSADGDVAATHVLNISTQKAAITDIEGYFTISAQLNDTLVFSAIQYQRKEIVVTTAILASKSIFVSLDPAVNQLNEVVVMPYNLSGDLSRDMQSQPVLVAATLGLPNSYVKKKTQSERLLIEATTGGAGIPLNPIINAITGRTKMLKENYKRDIKYERTERVRNFYSDSIYTSQLKIPTLKIDDFMYFCEVDPEFSKIVDTHDKIKILTFLRQKSVVYRKNNELD
ncbi:carboxypeptidase-like regulatory domain-containing protein [Cellulophaga tyrosinoxydans]|uniref:CarboxypepD_reg-like domain-containing protein n=1 Tax=Cellulophaga tyrosinoxydans TaxID=504486 RepID=A0A1W1Y7R5_9FLAO|nr:carboxypeptidase-like regulatory domain-containing protein [Cellulophaga tyrosinoxydans]SMC32174.1 CarboxypepD_reg-like domain-containing protein [Cellulophaga tyrosinoxydans]